MRRRDVLLGAMALIGTLPLARPLRPARIQGGEPIPFEAAHVRSAARQLAAQPFKPDAILLPADYADWSYDQYSSIAFDPAQALWHDVGGFEAQFFHRGFRYGNLVRIYEVAGGEARQVEYDPRMFRSNTFDVPTTPNLGFAGFRLHSALNAPNQLDELCAFLGDAEFRAVSAGLTYGLSAHGLLIGTEDGGHEAPAFKAFWIEKPSPDSSSVVVHALLDGPAATAAYRFSVKPRAEGTRMDVEMTLYPRRTLATACIAPMTSMYLFGSAQRARNDDYRGAVHSSDGLAIASGTDMRIWRPLQNPESSQVANFEDDGLRGFGLMQRQRSFEHFNDLDAGFETRPNLWIEPVGNWGRGSVVLEERPAEAEGQNNILAFWRPAQDLQAGSEYMFNYRMTWGKEDTAIPMPMAVIENTLIGRQDDLITVVLDYSTATAIGIDTRADVSGINSDVIGQSVKANKMTGGLRLTVTLRPTAPDTPVGLRAKLTDAKGRIRSEVLDYRWDANRTS